MIGLPEIANYSKTDFHGGTQTWDIDQDNLGRLYFANNEGLLTYDGTYWKTYTQPNKTILRSIAVFGNKIFAGGQDEIGYFTPDESGSLKYISLKSLIPAKYRSFTELWGIEVFQQSVFFRTMETIFEYKNNSIQLYPAPTSWQIMKKAGDGLYAQDKDLGLFQFVHNKWEPINSKESIPNFFITGICKLKDNSLLISSLQKGLFVVKNGTISSLKTDADRHFYSAQIYKLEQINESEFVAGTTSEGLFVINEQGGIVQQIAQPEGLQNNNILSLFLDRNKNVWAGLNNGISFIAYNSAIKYIQPNKNHEVSGYSCYILNNKLYIGSSDGAYVTNLTSTSKDFSFQKGSFKLIPNSSGQVWHLDEINNMILMGHHTGSFVLNNDYATHIPNTDGIWKYLSLSSIIPAKNILVGKYNGLEILNFSEKGFTKGKAITGINESLRFLEMDNNNEAWASHPYRGVYKILFSPDYGSCSTHLYTQKDGLPSTFRNHVFKIKNRIVFATEKGIYEFDERIKKFIPSPTFFNILGGINLQYLREDADGNIWFCSGKKIGVINFNNGSASSKYQIIYFPELSGKILSGFEEIYPYDRQNIFIASDKGIIHLNMNKYTNDHPVPEVLLSLIKVSGKHDSLFFDGYPFSTNVNDFAQNQQKVLAFPVNNNSFHFEFSTPELNQQKNIEFSTILEGYESNWSAWNSKSERDYTKLPNGTYIFKVKAHNNLGYESSIISYKFIVSPPWYKTKIAYFIFTLLLFVIIFSIYRLQQKKFVEQEKKFDEEQKKLKYIHQLELEKNEKEIIELQNEKLVNEVIFKNKELANVSLRLVERSDALLKIKEELQKLYKKTGENHDIKRTIHLVNSIDQNNSNWEQFAAHFNEINNDFLKKIKTKFPNLTNNDLKVCAYLQLNLSSKEIAQLMNITVRGVEINRYRLRKKMGLESETNLSDYIKSITKE